MTSHHPIRKVVTTEPTIIPDKLYFRIGDVARLCDVPAYVLRFWETEFPQLKPNKGGTGQRLYRRKDVETALRIKHLLYDLGYTIPGARQVFKADAKPEPAALAAAPLPEATPAEPHSKSVSKPVILSEAQRSGATNPDTLSAATLQQLHSLRDDLRALHTQLCAPVVTEPTPAPLRPRLVAEPKRPRLHKPEPKLEPRLGPIPIPGQQDLFPAE